MSSGLTIVHKHLQFPTVSLAEESPSVCTHIAAEIDSQPAFLPSNRLQKQTVARCNELCVQLQAGREGVGARVFKALLMPSGKGEFTEQRENVQGLPTYKALPSAISDSASFVYQITTSNIRRIAPVDHTRQGIFLFKYFFADNVEQNLAAWNHRANFVSLSVTDRKGFHYDVSIVF